MVTGLRNCGILALLALSLAHPAFCEESDEKPLVFKHVVKSDRLPQGQLTMFVRFPPGVKDGTQVNGVFAKCALAKEVGEIEKQLESNDEKFLGSYIAQERKFTNKHKFATVVWGASTAMWDRTQSYDELSTQKLRELDHLFDGAAESWEKGMKELCEKYKLPTKNYLLRGTSGAAQWAHRLALRKPERFLAVHVHVNSSYDEPTINAKKCLWLITTGEVEHGYPASKRFYAQCLKLGYPMIFKAEPNLKHTSNPHVMDLGIQFFEYAVSHVKGPNSIADFSDFQNPLFIGDLINQDVYPIKKAKLIPESQRVYLPTAELANAWGDVIK
jgi:hypothetical protein